MARASQGKGLDSEVAPKAREHTLDATNKGASGPAQSFSASWAEPVIPLDQALPSFLTPHPPHRPERAALANFQTYLLSLSPEGRAGETTQNQQRRRILAPPTVAMTDPLGKNQTQGRKEANISSQHDKIPSFPQTGFVLPPANSTHQRIRTDGLGSLLASHLSSSWESHWGPNLNPKATGLKAMKRNRAAREGHRASPSALTL